MANLYQFPSPHPPTWAGAPEYTLCVAVTAASPSAMLDQAATLLPTHPFLELRLDSLPDPTLLAPLLPTLLAQHPEAKLIATCRRTLSGGNFHGTLQAELTILAAAARAGCAIVDLALESAEAMPLDQLRLFRETLDQAGTALLISYHDYHHTRDLPLTFERLARFHPAIAKLVSTANTLSDNLPILHLLSAQHAVPVVAIAMGEPGIVSRVLGPRSGALFTFASSDQGAATAPGQVTASTLHDLYRLDHISPSTRVYGVAGKPIAHSLSPLLHNTAFRITGTDAVFLPLVTDSAADLLHLARELPIEGLSITMPLKQTILPLLDYVDPLAARVGACNTVVRTPHGQLHGYNTDVAGITAPLEKRLGTSLKEGRILIQGAGGAARAAVFGLRAKGAEVWILNRTASTAAALAAEAGAHLAHPSMVASANFDVLINATPAGMHGATAETLLSTETPLPAKLIFDMVYRPLETALIQKARAQGLPAITGVEMFVHQGARPFELWTGRPAPETELLRVILEALGARAD
jgi:3-dehydroquinate dehydratase/shikimate dehydrogenase